MELYLIRHGETEWSRARRHTGRTDLPLSPAGEAEARALGQHLRGLEVDRVLSSPLTRATTTADLAGFGDRVELTDALLEVDYGDYEGLTTTEIRASRPGWDLFRDGCPEGQSPDQIGARTDRVARRVRAIEGDVLLFSSGHFPRVFAGRWLGLEPGAGRDFFLGTASLCAVGYEHDRSDRVIRLWDEMPREQRISPTLVQGSGEKARR